MNTRKNRNQTNKEVNSKACEFFKKAKEQKTIAKKSIAKKKEKENK